MLFHFRGERIVAEDGVSSRHHPAAQWQKLSYSSRNQTTTALSNNKISYILKDGLDIMNSTGDANKIRIFKVLYFFYFLALEFPPRM